MKSCVLAIAVLFSLVSAGERSKLPIGGARKRLQPCERSLRAEEGASTEAVKRIWRETPDLGQLAYYPELWQWLRQAELKQASTYLELPESLRQSFENVEERLRVDRLLEARYILEEDERYVRVLSIWNHEKRLPQGIKEAALRGWLRRLVIDGHIAISMFPDDLQRACEDWAVEIERSPPRKRWDFDQEVRHIWSNNLGYDGIGGLPNSIHHSYVAGLMKEYADSRDPLFASLPKKIRTVYEDPEWKKECMRRSNSTHPITVRLERIVELWDLRDEDFDGLPTKINQPDLYTTLNDGILKERLYIGVLPPELRKAWAERETVREVDLEDNEYYELVLRIWNEEGRLPNTSDEEKPAWLWLYRYVNTDHPVIKKFPEDLQAACRTWAADLEKQRADRDDPVANINALWNDNMAFDGKGGLPGGVQINEYRALTRWVKAGDDRLKQLDDGIVEAFRDASWKRECQRRANPKARVSIQIAKLTTEFEGGRVPDPNSENGVFLAKGMKKSALWLGVLHPEWIAAFEEKLAKISREAEREKAKALAAREEKKRAAAEEKARKRAEQEKKKAARAAAKKAKAGSAKASAKRTGPVKKKPTRKKVPKKAASKKETPEKTGPKVSAERAALYRELQQIWVDHNRLPNHAVMESRARKFLDSLTLEDPFLLEYPAILKAVKKERGVE